MDKSITEIERKHENKENTDMCNNECWICMSEGSEPLIRPCKCKGSTKYVHTSCFTNFISNKNIQNTNCSFCTYKYVVKYNNALFLRAYATLQKLNHIGSTLFFLLLFLVICYSVMFIYGFCVLILFAGYDNMIEYTKQSFSQLKDGRIYLWSKLSYAAPIIPFALIVSTCARFKFGLHVLTCVLLIDTIDYKWLFIYFLPLTLFLYKSSMYKIQKSLGRVETVRSGVIVNEHQFDLRSLFDVLSCPFVGALVSNILTIEEKMWRYVIGTAIYMFVKDIVCVYYLYCDKKRLTTMIVEEFVEEEGTETQ